MIAGSLYIEKEAAEVNLVELPGILHYGLNSCMRDCGSDFDPQWIDKLLAIELTFQSCSKIILCGMPRSWALLHGIFDVLKHLLQKVYYSCFLHGDGFRNIQTMPVGPLRTCVTTGSGTSVLSIYAEGIPDVRDACYYCVNCKF